MELRTVDGWVERAWRGSPWPIAPVTLVTSGDEASLQRFAGKWLLGESQGDPHLSPEVERRAADRRRTRLLRQLDEVGGVFVVTDETKQVERDLTDPDYGEQFVRAALQARFDDPRAVTDLVTTYGWLGGIELPSRLGTVASAFGINPWTLSLDVKSGRMALNVTALRGSLSGTIEVLRDFRRHVEWLERLKLGPAGERDWGAFAESLEPFIKGISPTIRWERDAGPQPCWKVTSPRSLLWATVWDWATRGGQLRRCRNQKCEVLFPADDPRQEFCSRPCTNRASAAAWYRKKGRAERRAARRRRKVKEAGR